MPVPVATHTMRRCMWSSGSSCRVLRSDGAVVPTCETPLGRGLAAGAGVKSRRQRWRHRQAQRQPLARTIAVPAGPGEGGGGAARRLSTPGAAPQLGSTLALPDLAAQPACSAPAAPLTNYRSHCPPRRTCHHQLVAHLAVAQVVGADAALGLPRVLVLVNHAHHRQRAPARWRQQQAVSSNRQGGKRKMEGAGRPAPPCSAAPADPLPSAHVLPSWASP